jgi:hypothetical protein
MKPSLKWVLIGDMVRSRRVRSRPDVRSRIDRALARANQAFPEALWAPLRLIKGIDEFSGVLNTPEPVFEILTLLNLEVHPLRFRMAAAHGEVRALSRDRDAGKMDGSAFFLASEALERARRERMPLGLATIPGDPARLLADAAEAIAALDSSIRDRWPAAVREIAGLMSGARDPALTQQQVGRRTRRSQQAVSRAAVRGRFKDLGRARSAIRKLLAGLSQRV